MKSLRAFALCLLCLSSFVLAQNAGKDPVFWYEFTIMRGNTTETFVGSSSMEPDDMAQCLTGKDAIMLENLRSLGAKAGDQPMRWWPVREGQQLFIRPESVAFYFHLPADPKAE